MAEKPFKLHNTLEDFAAPLRPVLEESLDSMDFLLQLTRDDTARVPEPIFVEHLLPLLANRTGNQSLVRWQQIAGTVMRSLDVFHPQTGETLYRVPPILRSINRELTEGSRHSAFEIIRTAEQKSKVIPSLGDRHIQTHLVERMKPVRVPIQDVLAWNAILKRYGYPSLLSEDVESATTPAAAPAVTTTTPVVEGYDDL